MLTTAAALAALGAALAGPGELALTNPRLTYGLLGPTRADNQLLPGDSLTVAFDIDGLTADDGGKVRYRTATEVTGPDGKTLFRQPPQDVEAVNALGGGRVPAFAQVDIGLAQPPGPCALKVTVTDPATNNTQALTQKFEVLPRGFGLARVALTDDAEGRLPAGLLGAGQSVWVNFVVVGFGRAAGGAADVALEVRVLDEAGQPTVAKPFRGSVGKDAAAGATAVPVHFPLALNRPGKFTLELRAADRAGGGSATRPVPLTVLGLP